MVHYNDYGECQNLFFFNADSLPDCNAVINNKFSIDVLIMYVYINLQLSLDHVMHIHAHATGQQCRRLKQGPSLLQFILM